MSDEDRAVLKKYGIDEDKNEPILNAWESGIAYICYIVEKNTNIFVDKNTNMIQVFDRYDCIVYESEINKENGK